MTTDGTDLELLAERATAFWGLLLRAQRIVGEQAARRASGGEFSLIDPASVARSFMEMGLTLASQPQAWMTAQANAMERWASFWTGAMSGQGGPVKDRRFRDEGWQSDMVSRFWRDMHLTLEDAVAAVLNQLPEGSKDRLRVEFYTRQLLSAISPANVLALNPAARERFVETGGQSLIDGLSNLLDDLEKGGGRLDITTTEKRAFTVGKDLGATPGKVVFRNDLIELIQYEPMTKTQKKRPLLLVPAWINKFYILDMRPKNSLVRYMLERGHTVFIISWVNADQRHADKGFEDYMKEGPLAAIDAIEQATGESRINILGFCIGGILVTATLAWLAAKGEDRIATATTLATMVDFKDVGEAGVFVDREQLERIRGHVSKTGALEGHHLKDMFSMLRENDLIWSFHVMNYLMGRRPPPFDLLYWNADSTRLPARMLTWYLEKIYIENALREPGGLTLDGTPLDIGKIAVPAFVLATKEDHIAPWRSVYPAARLFGGEVTFVLGGSGHIAGVINPPADKPKYGYWTGTPYPDDPEAWLKGAEHAEGSWWPFWASWLEKRDRAKQVPARVPGEGGLEVLCDAPGTYVMAT